MLGLDSHLGAPGDLPDERDHTCECRESAVENTASTGNGWRC